MGLQSDTTGELSLFSTYYTVFFLIHVLAFWFSAFSMWILGNFPPMRFGYIIIACQELSVLILSAAVFTVSFVLYDIC